MDFSAPLDDLQKRAAEAKASVQAAATESRDKLRQRIDQAQADVDLATKNAKQQAADTADRAQSQWAQMKADASAKMDDVKAKIDKRTDQAQRVIGRNPPLNIHVAKELDRRLVSSAHRALLAFANQSQANHTSTESHPNSVENSLFQQPASRRY